MSQRIYATDPVNLGEVTDESRVYIEQRWACVPPAVGTKFRVLRDEWDDDYLIRTIFEWEAA